MISGIKRKSTAIESAFRYFQTVDLIISHFKREADKQKIFELLDETFTLKDLLISTASIHIYHNLGIRVEEAIDIEKGTVESSKKQELMEKKVIFDEIKELLKDSFQSEIDILFRIIALENKFIDLLIEIRDPNILESQRESVLEEIDKYLEKELRLIILDYKSFNFYDLMGDLIGINNNIKKEIFEESGDLKELSMDLEKRLKKKEKEDKYIELSTLNKMIEEIKENFEFKSYQELKMQAMPVRMIKKRIINYDMERFPVSVPGLISFREANELKKNIIDKIKENLEKKIDYEHFENEIFTYMKKEIIKQLNTNPNDFVYFLQNLNEESFEEIVYTLNKYGIFNILEIINLNDDIAEEVKKNMIRYNIKKFDIIQLNDKKKNILVNTKKILNQLGNEYLDIKQEEIKESNIVALLKEERDKYEGLWDKIEKETGNSYVELREFIRKKEIVDKIFLDKLGLINYSQILISLDFDKIIDNLVKDTYYYLLSKILRQLSRIIEAFLKITNEKALYLLAFKKMYNATESEEWIWIKFEELIIQRLKNRQEELVVLFDADNKPFLINGFILARLTETSLAKAVSKLKNEPSPLYEGIKQIKLKKDLISPISYCLAYDLVKRFEEYEDLRKSRVRKALKAEEQKKEKIRKEIRKSQEKSTLNWIERRITSSLMRINSPGINPNQLYWEEKDTKIASDNIKLHSELEGDTLDLFCEYFLFAREKIKELYPAFKLPSPEKIENVVKNIANKILQDRIGQIPNKEEINNMFDGERFKIAQEIAKRMGKLLDKALYSKFKENRR
jgi:hypothetical protein